jgi:hypothetical protein
MRWPCPDPYLLAIPQLFDIKVESVLEWLTA